MNKRTKKSDESDHGGKKFHSVQQSTSPHSLSQSRNVEMYKRKSSRFKCHLGPKWDQMNFNGKSIGNWEPWSWNNTLLHNSRDDKLTNWENISWRALFGGKAISFSKKTISEGSWCPCDELLMYNLQACNLCCLSSVAPVISFVLDVILCLLCKMHFLWDFILCKMSWSVCSKSKQSPDGGRVLMYWLHAANVGKGRKKEEQVQAKWYSRSSLCTQAYIHTCVENHDHNIFTALY